LYSVSSADVDPTTPMAVLFPPISHVTQHNKVEKQEGESLSDLSDSAAVPEISLDIPLGTFINTSEPTSAKPDLTVSSGNCQNEGEAWCESFRPKLSTEVAGNSNSVQRLKDWLEGWRQRIVTSEEQPANTSDSGNSNDIVLNPYLILYLIAVAMRESNHVGGKYNKYVTMWLLIKKGCNKKKSDFLKTNSY
jgi:hypothetical protein